MSDRLTFEQREGTAALPTQLKPKFLSRELRALLWLTVHDSIQIYGGDVTAPWSDILRDNHVRREHGMVSTYNDGWWTHASPTLAALFDRGSYEKVLGFIEFVLRHEQCPVGFDEAIETVLRQARAAYRVLDHDTITLIGTEQEATAINAALSATETTGFEGARKHLKEAASLLSAGSWAGSVRESIHAVESVAVVLSPGSNTLGPALKALAAKTAIHEALKGGFNQIYGFTSDESGIRHALLDKGDANVDEADALFMLGACASFVTYLIAKSRAAGLLPE